jgi:hypothetical protein
MTFVGGLRDINTRYVRRTFEYQIFYAGTRLIWRCYAETTYGTVPNRFLMLLAFVVSLMVYRKF